MSYTYTPDDIALFLSKANLPLRYEQAVLHRLWSEQAPIDVRYYQNETVFRRDVRRAAARYTLHDNGMDELDIIMRDIGLDIAPLHPNFEHDVIFQFFKVIRLTLLYVEGRTYYKIKLRRLIKQFKYKRRSQSLVANIKSALLMLSLSVYTRGHVLCDIATVDIDEMIMIRLSGA